MVRTSKAYLRFVKQAERVKVRWVVFVCALSLLSFGSQAQSQSSMDVSLDGILRLLSSGAYAEAEREATAVTGAAEAQYGEDSLQLANARDILVDALIQNGKANAPSTLTAAERACAVKEQRLGPGDLQLSISLNRLGAVHSERGEFSEAVSLHKRALSISLAKLPPTDPAIADTLDRLAVAQ